MDEFRVPTLALEAELRYFDERLLSGQVFIPAHARQHEGPMRAEEWMNQAHGFFPFVGRGERRARILNKRYVVVLTLDRETNDEPFGVPRRVVVECGTLRLEGIIYVEMPDHVSRLLDWVNRPEPFLVVHEGGKRHLIQKNRITVLSEVLED
ncbi:MAG TPA: hypothetical protein VF698_12115 [Thermoanaerobaculia bacterium]|jgi:hypothetical protein